MAHVRTSIRLALVVVGLAAAIYGAASLTGGWLGTPPWWQREVAVLDRFREYGPPRPGREGISVAVIAGGLVLAVFAGSSLRRRRATAPPMAHAVLLVLVVVGLAATVYGVASLTGGWLGTPPWWKRRVFGPTTEAPGPPGIHHAPTLWIEPRPDRGLISAGVMAAGLGVAILGAWPRRRRSRPAT
jgi:hypothetical protein